MRNGLTCLLLMFVTFSTSTVSAIAAAPKLGLPIRCTFGKDCFIQQYVDVDSESAYSDYTCGSLSYQAHKGTDFAILNTAQIATHVPVIASADGKVMGVRDGEQDGLLKKEGEAAVKNKECGNGVRLEHEDGWTTQYCHMLKGSVQVRKGQLVKEGDVLGYVGMSGAAEFPHVHLQVEHNKQVIDPFTGEDPNRYNCRSSEHHPLWHETPSYIKTGIVQGGFINREPDYESVQQGIEALSIIPQDSELLAFWVQLYGAQPGDILHMQMLSPNSDVLAYHKNVLEKKRIRDFFYIGKRFSSVHLIPGEYIGHIRLLRGKEAVLDKRWTVTVK